MGRRVHNLHLDAIAFVRHQVGCDYGAALRLVQLYGFLEHIASQGGGCQFSQATYCRKTGCSRNTVAADLQTLSRHGWLTAEAGVGGTRVRLIGLPFDRSAEVAIASDGFDQATACKASQCRQAWTCTVADAGGGCSPGEQGDAHRVSRGCSPAEQGGAHGVSSSKKGSKNLSKKGEEQDQPPTPALAVQPSAGPVEASPSDEGEAVSGWQPKPRTWTAEKRERVRQIWNQHRPANFAAMAEGGLDHDRANTVARSMYGRGGYTAFVELLPQVLEHLKRDSFWGNPSKRFTWDNFFGTANNRKQHWAQAVDEITATPLDRGLQPDRIPVRFEPFGEQWIPMANSLGVEEFIRAAIDLVKAGGAPRSALQYLEPWTPDHPYNSTLDD